MKNLKIATAQFENKCGDKNYNLSVIEKLSQKASIEGCDVISFHECSITGYTFARHLSKEQMLNLAEIIPSGESILKLIEIAKKNALQSLQDFLKRMKIIIFLKHTFVLTKMVWSQNTENFIRL